jgi:hypothetical protein
MEMYLEDIQISNLMKIKMVNKINKLAAIENKMLKSKDKINLMIFRMVFYLSKKIMFL